MAITIEQFTRNRLGTKCKHRLGKTGQCVCLYRCFLDEVLEVPQSPGVIGAKNLWGTYDPDIFVRIPYSALARPIKNDIVIFDAFPGNPYGHVDMATKNGALTIYQGIDSNWSRPLYTTLENHNYQYVKGWLRKIGFIPITDQEIKQYFRSIWKKEPAYGDWLYFRNRIKQGTILDDRTDLERKVRFTYQKYKELGNRWWQNEKDKVNLPK